MVDMTVEIVTSRAIAQQILRHRSFSFQEFSQRYSSALDFEEVELRKAGSTNRQSSVNKFNPIIDKNSPFTAESYIKKHQELCKELYDKLIDLGVAKECARFVLPLSTQTKIYMKGSIRSFIHYLEIRCGEDTQLEHRQVALAVLDIFKENFPNISENLKF
jgi:thymidylate synthase (FAD)